jgi:hypothetical protein
MLPIDAADTDNMISEAIKTSPNMDAGLSMIITIDSNYI